MMRSLAGHSFCVWIPINNKASKSECRCCNYLINCALRVQRTDIPQNVCQWPEWLHYFSNKDYRSSWLSFFLVRIRVFNIIINQIFAIFIYTLSVLHSLYQCEVEVTRVPCKWIRPLCVFSSTHKIAMVMETYNNDDYDDNDDGDDNAIVLITAMMIMMTTWTIIMK